MTIADDSASPSIASSSAVLHNKSVSIAMAVYNGSEFVEAQLNSIADQSTLPTELIIADDGSTDNTVEICRRFSEGVPFSVRILESTSNLGYTMNFQRALKCCSGDVVMLSDQDDVWYPNKIEHMLQEFNRDRSAALLIHDLQFCDANLRRIGETKIERILRYSDDLDNYITGMATAIRQDFLHLALPVPDTTGISHDKWLHMCAAAIGVRRVTRCVLADYRRHTANATAGELLNSVRVVSAEEFARSHRSEVSEKRTIGILQHRLVQKKAIEIWLHTVGGGLIAAGYITSQNLDDVLRQRRRTIIAYETRVSILRTARVSRFFRIVAALINGTYSHFRGLASAGKDLFQR